MPCAARHARLGPITPPRRRPPPRPHSLRISADEQVGAGSRNHRGSSWARPQERSRCDCLQGFCSAGTATCRITNSVQSYSGTCTPKQTHRPWLNHLPHRPAPGPPTLIAVGPLPLLGRLLILILINVLILGLLLLLKRHRGSRQGAVLRRLGGQTGWVCVQCWVCSDNFWPLDRFSQGQVRGCRAMPQGWSRMPWGGPPTRADLNAQRCVPVKGQHDARSSHCSGLAGQG